MKRQLLQWLACPICLGDLDPDVGDEVIESGTLVCSNCAARYPIQAGLPILMVKDRFWNDTSTEVEGEQEFVVELPLSEHIKRNLFETERSMKLLKQVEIPRQPLVLDVGGSSGLGTYLFKEYGAEAVITDIVPVFLQLAEECLGSVMNVHGAPSGVEWLPFKDDTFDIVFCRQALHHSLEPELAIEEMFRVTKPGGRVLIASEPCLSTVDLIKVKYYRLKRGAGGATGSDILDKLPDERFAEGWPSFKRWIAAVSEDFRIFPAGGSAITIPTENGLVFVPNFRERRWMGKILNRALPGHRGFRGDINIVARKTRPIGRSKPREAVVPLEAGEWNIERLPEAAIQNQREVFPKMFPFPVKI